MSPSGRPFRVLAIQQVAVGGLDKAALRRFWVDLLGIAPVHSCRNEAENVDEDILRLGAGPETVTALHYAEYLAAVPDKRRTRWDYLLATAEGPKHVFVECLDDNEGIRDWPGEDYFAAITKAYLATGRARTGAVGDATAELIDAADLVAFGARWMERAFG